MWTPLLKRLSLDQQTELCDAFGIPLREQNTVLKVESSGVGFGLLPDARPIILFERHYFWRLLPAPLRAKAFAEQPDICNPSPGGYATGQLSKGPDGKVLKSAGLVRCEREWERMDRAVKIHRQAALQSASWGLGQLMGTHWRDLGCTSVQEFVNLNFKNEQEQSRLQLRFIANSLVLKTALLKHNWKVFAAGYNGKYYYKANPPYDVRLQRAWDSLA